MTQPSQQVGAFVQDAYQLINPSSPTVPLMGNDMLKGIQFLNELLRSYAGNGLMITVSKEVEHDIFPVVNAPYFLTIGDSDYVPTPDISSGRLVDLENAWIILDNVSYPLIIETRNDFFASYKFSPLAGLPRYIIVYPQTNLTTVQVYPGPSQFFELHMYGKFELPSVVQSDTLTELPQYYIRYLRFALARDLAFYKGRSEAWTEKLQSMYKQAEDDMKSTSSFNLQVQPDRESMLNGFWRVKAGV